MQGDSTDEVLLAEEQAVISRGVGIIEEVEAAFDSGKETEGTLVLTNKRLLYVHGGSKEDDISVGQTMPFVETKKRLIFSDVRDLDSIPPDPANLSIPLDSVVFIVGHRREAMAPKLEVRWSEGGENRVAEFVQQITGSSRRKNLNDWATVIQNLKSGQQKVATMPSLPDKDSLEGRIFFVLGDMQEKGLFTIEREVEEEFGIDLDPDDVEKASERLVSWGLVQRSGAAAEDPFYQKSSPLGDDDLGR